MKRSGLDVGIADQAGERNGAASFRSAILPPADSEQRIPLFGWGRCEYGWMMERFWISCRFCLWKTSFILHARSERKPTCRTNDSLPCMEIIWLIWMSSMPIGSQPFGHINNREEKGNVQWCHDNYINSRSMKTAVEIRKQLVGYCQKIGIEEIVTCVVISLIRAAKGNSIRFGVVWLLGCSCRLRIEWRRLWRTVGVNIKPL